MSPQSNDDLDRQIREQDGRIRSNPRDAVAYRERGSFHARKRDLDHALKDLNQAVLLDPKDPRALGLRGWVLHALKEDRKAIADFDKAIELDPGHADLYRAHRDKIAGSASAEPNDAPSSKRPNGAATAQTGLRQASAQDHDIRHLPRRGARDHFLFPGGDRTEGSTCVRVPEQAWAGPVR